MKRFVVWVTSLTLAFSLFGIPAVGFAEPEEADGALAGTDASDLLDAGESQAEGAIAQLPGSIEGGEDGNLVLDVGGGEGINNWQRPEQEEAGTASFYVELTSYAPSGIQAGLTLALESEENGVALGQLQELADATADSLDPSAAASGNAEPMHRYYALVTGVAPGSYAFTCKGAGFVPYEQQVELEAGTRVELYLIDSLNASDLSGSGQGGRGQVLYGDFDASGSVDAADATMMVAALDTDEDAYDVYGPGVVSLEDIQYFASFFMPGEGDVTDSLSPLLRKVDASGIKVTTESTSLDDIEVTGELSDLLAKNGKSVILAPAKDEEGNDVAISTENPIRLIFETNDAPMEGLTLRSPLDSEGMPQTGIVLVEKSDGASLEIPFGEGYVAPAPDQPDEADAPEAQSEEGADLLSSLLGAEEAYAASGVSGAEVDAANGLIVVDFGSRIAIKKITIRITATTSNKLAEIAEVEFLNNMEERIAPPDLNIPGNLVGIPSKKSFRVTWSPEVNVTGYEVRVSQGGATATFSTVLPSLDVSRFNGGELKNGTDYTVSVRSANGDWRSPWSDPITVTPKATSVPARPIGVSAVGGYGEVTVKWNSSEDADSYILYYRASTASSYQQVTTTATSYVLTPLSLSTEYTGYIVAVNDIGRSPSSEAWKTSTTGNQSIKVPQYKLINEGGNRDGHITSITAETDDPGHASAPNDEALNPGFQAEQMVDGNYDTYFHGAGRSSYNYGANVEFDQAYSMDKVAVTTYLGTGYDSSIYYFTVRVRDASGQWTHYGNGSALTWERVSTTNASGVAEVVPSTWMVNFPRTDVTAIRISFTFYNYDKPVTISELAFYEYDGIQDDLDALWVEDAMYTELKGEVDQGVLDDLAARIEERDHGELHPKHDLYVRTLAYAQDVYDNQAQMKEVVKVDPALNAKTDTSPVGGLSDLQPLGVTVRQGDQVSVYVGLPGMALGSNASALQLVVAPYHAAASGVTQVAVPTLKPGRNDFTVSLDNIASTDEAGGQLYVRYASSTPGLQYTVRVIGGTKAPMLDLHGVTDQAERIQLCKEYLEELDSYVAKLAQTHADCHHGGSYVPSTCTANVTDIVIDTLMYSIPATQAQAGVGTSGTLDERAAKLEKTLSAGDELMDLYYQHKGLKKEALTADEAAKYGTSNNVVPKRRQNVRYMDMSGGVFMYAAGNHIGIQYGSCSGPTATPGVSFDADGKYQSGYYFGWGLCHEIGHEINQGCYTYAEVTNNYYSQLAMAQDSNIGMRWGDTYQAVYNRVTSGLKGAAAGKTGIAMYWQLHLAYDDGLNFKTYDSYEEQMENLVFARMDAYARNPGSAPKAEENGFTFTLAGADKDNALMRLACAATKTNLLAFFEAWGLTPDGTTLAYAQQWPVEERAIQYISDDVRLNGRLAGMGSVADKVAVSGSLDYQKGSSQVTVNLSVDPKDGFLELFTGSNRDRFLGFEVLRDGVPVGFVEAGEDGTATFTDTIATVNNRVFTYSVRGVDMLLGYTEEAVCTPDEVKVSHDGSIDKTSWTITGNAYEPTDDTTMDDEMPCEAPDSTAVDKVRDNDKATVFNGVAESGSATITVNFGATYALSAVKVANGHDSLADYTIETSLDGATWTQMNKGESVADGAMGTTTVFFGNPEDPEDKQVHTMDAGYLRLTAPDATMEIAELDVLGPTGDNVWFGEQEGDELAIGRLKEDFVVSEQDGEVVPADSTVIIGGFKGNAAYNAIKLYDQDGNLLPGSFLFYQDVAPNAYIGETADGRWVYFITPEMREEVGWVRPTAVRAELYRVDNALTLEGERHVADTLTASVPDILTGIEIKTNVPGN